jgi:hypothetical protein
VKVGAERDWDLDVYLATWKTGEQGLHLRFRRAEQQFIMFLSAAEARELVTQLEECGQGLRESERDAR